MGEEARQLFQDKKKMGSINNEAWCSKLMIMEGENSNEMCDSVSTESSIEESSENSISYISPSDIAEDASSATPSSNEPLYELSELMAQLPIRRGLSKHYQGKSQSFTSLASVRSIQDLPKKANPCKRAKMKQCKSYGGGLEAHNSNNNNNNNKSYGPKAAISKKASSRSCLLSSIAGCNLKVRS